MSMYERAGTTVTARPYALDRSTVRPVRPGRSPRPFAPPSHRWRTRLLVALGVLVVLGALGLMGGRRLALATAIEGVAEGAQLRPAVVGGRQVQWRVRPASSARGAQVRLDGDPVRGATVDDGVVRWLLPADLDAGHHTLSLTVKRPVVVGQVTRSWGFTIDDRAPALEVLKPAPVALDAPVTVTGTVEAGATVRADDQPVAVTHGQFRLDYPAPPTGAIHLVAADAAGNTTTVDLAVPIVRPTTRAVHVRASDWNNPAVRAQIDELIAAGKINAVQLDIKDESGAIGYQSQVPLARDIGATRDLYDVAAVLADLHGRGVRVIGRIVAFRDPILAKAAWARGLHDAVLQDPSGGPLRDYGGFTNYVNPMVREYNLALAVEAGQAGFDEILWDYVRRPEGDPAGMVVPGLGEGRSSDHIASFVAEGQARLRPLRVRQGASVFGIAASRPQAIAQDIPAMAAHLDYVAPMVYPSHWGRGEYGTRDPLRQPYDIVYRSVADFQKVTAGTAAGVVPWLQDFDDGVPYGPEQIADQVRAIQDLGVDGFLLWNASSRYTVDGLTAG